MQTITFSEFDTWLEGQHALVREHAWFEHAEHFDGAQVHFYRGDLNVDTLTAAPVLVVEGNVTAQSISHEYDVGLIVVTGDLTCAHIGALSIDLIVGGNLKAQSICANTGNDHILIVGGDIVSDYFSEYGCYVEAQGKIICPQVLNQMNEVIAHGGIEGRLIRDVRGQAIGEVLVGAVLTDDGYFDQNKFATAVQSGQSPYKA